MTYNQIIKQVSKELDIPVEVVNKAYKSYWQFIKKTIQDLPLDTIDTKEELDKLRTSFNIPSLGKLYINRYGFEKYKTNYKKNTQNVDNKED